MAAANDDITTKGELLRLAAVLNVPLAGSDDAGLDARALAQCHVASVATVLAAGASTRPLLSRSCQPEPFTVFQGTSNGGQRVSNLRP